MNNSESFQASLTAMKEQNIDFNVLNYTIVSNIGYGHMTD